MEAACQSRHFFLAPRNDQETSRLHTLIGQNLRPALEEAVVQGFEDVLPKRSDNEAASAPLDAHALGWQPTSTLRYELVLDGCGDQQTTQTVEETVIELVDEIARALPLERLDGITIGGDYPALLRAVDRGWDGAPVPETVPAEIGTGIAQVVTVKRRGMIKGRIVASSIVSSALISEDLEERGWGTHAFVKQLAHVALMEILEKQLPGTLLEPTDDGIDGWLYANVGGAPESYAASWMAAGFGFPEVIAAGYRDLLAVAFEWMMTKVPEERLAYREHGDLDRLLNVALPAIRHVLMVAANLHGHCAFSGSLPLGESGSLCDALEDAGLLGWFGVYGDDLARFHRRSGRWTSFEEFLAFGIHVERLLLALGMFVSESPEGLRVEVPLGTDAEALVARMREG